MLRAGGSAVDACVAAAFASWIAEPALTGPGGGGFLVGYDAARRRPLAIDCFVAVPGGPTTGGRSPRSSPTSSTSAPGSRRSSSALDRAPCPASRRGSRRRTAGSGGCPGASWRARRSQLARAGVELTPAHADVIDLLKGFLGASPEGARVFGPPDAPSARRRPHEQPAARRATLERIAADGARELADGETADAIVAYQAARRRAA